MPHVEGDSREQILTLFQYLTIQDHTCIDILNFILCHFPNYTEFQGFTETMVMFFYNVIHKVISNI